MFDFSGLGAISSADIQAYGAVLFFALVVAFAGNETRAYLSLIAALLVAPSAATVYVMAVLHLIPNIARAIKKAAS